MFPEEPDEEDWRNEIKREVGKLKCGGSIKELKDYTLIKGSYTEGCLEGSCPNVSVRKKER